MSEQQQPPNPPPRRSGTDTALPQGQDRSHQVEVMQSYEMARPQNEDEVSPLLLSVFPVLVFIYQM